MLDLDPFVHRVMQTFRVPGIAVAVIQDGAVLLTRGYGVSKLGSDEPVDADTVFGIASNTKLFTATALAILVDEGKVAWNDRVQKHLPSFALSDPYVSHELTVKDLLVHRSGLGLGAGDLHWWPGTTYTTDEVIERLRYIPLATSFRNEYAYDNVLYLVAGKLISALSSVSYQEFVQTRILDRVGMSRSISSFASLPGLSNVAGTHALVDWELVNVEPFLNDITGPSGGIMSSANDMARWLQVQLSHGELPDGSRLFLSARSCELWTPVTPIPIPRKEVSPALLAIRPHFSSYALGVHAQDYRGHRLLTHSGHLPGYVSCFSLLPELGAGVVVLTNAESFSAFWAVSNFVQDWLVGAEKVDWIFEYQATLAASVPEPPKRKEGTSPSLALSEYAGTYRDRWYGDVTVSPDLVMSFTKTPLLVGHMEHWHHDTFVVRWRDRTLRADAFVTFCLGADGTVESARMSPFDSGVDFSFNYRDLELVRVAGASRP